MLQEILPQLERLREQKQVLLKYRQIESDAMLLLKQIVATEYTAA